MIDIHTGNILVSLPGPLGDAVLATPALAALRTALPEAKITFLASPTNHAALEAAGLNDHWIDQPAGRGAFSMARQLRRTKFDAAVLLPNSFRAAALIAFAAIPVRIGYSRDARGPLLTHPLDPVRLPTGYPPLSMLEYYYRLVAHALAVFNRPAPPRDNHLRLATTDADRAEVDRLFATLGISSPEHLVVLVPGAAFGRSKLWPAERFAALADRFIERHCCHVLLSCAPTPFEKHIVADVRAASHYHLSSLADTPLSLGGLKELIRRASLVVANDTGPCHFAAAFGTPLVTLFGPTDPRWTATGNPRETRIRVDVDCGPCQQKNCLEPVHRCLTAIDAEAVYAAARRLVTNPPPPDAPEYWPGRPATFYSAFDESFVVLEPDTLVHRAHQPLLQQAGLDSIRHILDHHGGDALVKPGLGTRERIRLELPGPDDTPVAVYLKRFADVSFVDRLRAMLRLCAFSPGLREFTNALALARCHIPVPRPIACGQETSGSTRRNFVLFEELPNADALERLLPRLDEVRDQYDLLGRPRRLIREIALLVVRLHRAGFYHRDLYLSHLFLARDDQGRQRLHLIDLARVFRPCRFRRYRWQVKDLAQLYYSARPYFSNTDALRFLRAYLACDRFTPAHRRLIRAIRRKADRIARHDARKQQRESQQEPQAR